MKGGPVWSHGLASLLGGVVVAGILLAFGVIGTSPTQTVPITNVTTPAASAGDSPAGDLQQSYLRDAPGVVSVRAPVGRRISGPFGVGTQPVGSVSTGSGVLLSRKGYVLTAFHVIEGALAGPTRPITVRLDTELTRTAAVIQESQADDVALLKINMRGVPPQIRPLTLGRSRGLAVGNEVLAIANADGQRRTLSRGIVAALAPELNGAAGGISGVIETDLAPDPVASGGPLLDPSGAVIGIVSELAAAGPAPAVAFAVPIETARSIIPAGLLR